MIVSNDFYMPDRRTVVDGTLTTGGRIKLTVKQQILRIIFSRWKKIISMGY